MFSFNELRGGTAPNYNPKVPSYSPKAPSGGQSILRSKPLESRPKTRSCENDISEMNAALRMDKVQAASNKQILQDEYESGTNFKISQGEGEYLAAVESFQNAIEAWSGSHSDGRPVGPTGPSEARTVAKVGNGKRPESRNRKLKETQGHNRSSSAYKQSAPMVFLHNGGNRKAAKSPSSARREEKKGISANNNNNNANNNGFAPIGYGNPTTMHSWNDHGDFYGDPGESRVNTARGYLSGIGSSGQDYAEFTSISSSGSKSSSNSNSSNNNNNSNDDVKIRPRSQSGVNALQSHVDVNNLTGQPSSEGSTSRVRKLHSAGPSPLFRSGMSNADNSNIDPSTENAPYSPDPRDMVRDVAGGSNTSRKLVPSGSPVLIEESKSMSSLQIGMDGLQLDNIQANDNNNNNNNHIMTTNNNGTNTSNNYATSGGFGNGKLAPPYSKLHTVNQHVAIPSSDALAYQPHPEKSTLKLFMAPLLHSDDGDMAVAIIPSYIDDKSDNLLGIGIGPASCGTISTDGDEQHRASPTLAVISVDGNQGSLHSNSNIGRDQRPQSRKLYLGSDAVIAGVARSNIRAPRSAGARTHTYSQLNTSQGQSNVVGSPGSSVFEDDGNDVSSGLSPGRLMKRHQSLNGLVPPSWLESDLAIQRPPSRQSSAFPVHLGADRATYIDGPTHVSDEHMDHKADRDLTCSGTPSTASMSRPQSQITKVRPTRPPSRQKVGAQHLFDKNIADRTVARDVKEPFECEEDPNLRYDLDIDGGRLGFSSSRDLDDESVLYEYQANGYQHQQQPTSAPSSSSPVGLSHHISKHQHMVSQTAPHGNPAVRGRGSTAATRSHTHDPISDGFSDLGLITDDLMPFRIQVNYDKNLEPVSKQRQTSRTSPAQSELSDLDSDTENDGYEFGGGEIVSNWNNVDSNYETSMGDGSFGNKSSWTGKELARLKEANVFSDDCNHSGSNSPRLAAVVSPYTEIWADDDNHTVLTEDSYTDLGLSAVNSIQTITLESSLGEDFLSLFAPGR